MATDLLNECVWCICMGMFCMNLNSHSFLSICIFCITFPYIQGRGKVSLLLGVHKIDFILVLLYINVWIIFHKSNHKPTFALPYITITKILNNSGLKKIEVGIYQMSLNINTYHLLYQNK